MLARFTMLACFILQCFTNADFWWRYENSDCGYDDVKGKCSGMADECKQVCDNTTGCGGFNSHGFLKKTDCGQHIAPAATILYVRKPTPQPEPMPPWQNIWPIPQSFNFSVGSKTMGLSPNIYIAVSNESTPRLARGIGRYRKLLALNTPRPGVHVDVVIETVTLDIHDFSEDLNKFTNYSYSLKISASGKVLISAHTMYGALYALETFSQLPAASGVINATSIEVKDWPEYHHRAFMADTGRRFWPVPTITSLLDAMAWNKMNVLHLHLSDNCRFAMESTTFPELTQRLVGALAGHYTHNDVHTIVSYAADRGIRVIPEIDIPGHAQGLQGLAGKGLNYCGDGGSDPYAFADLRNDANGTTVETLKELFRELASLFPDQELFIGADEASPMGNCTMADYKAIETEVASFVRAELNRTVGGWEELAFTTKVAQPSPPGAFVINSWHYHTQAESTALGFQTIAANDSHLYLVYKQPWQKYWVDLASGLNASQRSLLKVIP